MDFGRQLADLMQGSEPAETPAPAKRIAKVIDPERLRRLTGLAEAAATFGTGLAASVPAGMAGMAQMIPTRGRVPDVNKAAQTVEDVQGALTYLPRTPTGQRVLERGAGALEMLGAPAEYLGEKTLQYTGSPAAATAANVLLDPVNFIGMPGSGKAIATGTKAAGRAAAAAPRVAGEMLQDLMMGQGRMEGQRGAIKMKGGNWLAGEVEGATEPLRQKGAVGSSPEEMLAQMRERYTPEVIAALEPPLQESVARSFKTLDGMFAINNWIDKKLNRYIKNEMATPEDPVRKLAEQGILHYEPRVTNFLSGYAQAHRRGEGEQLGLSPLAKVWEDISDSSILPSEAVDFQSGSSKFIKQQNPWIDKVSPETKIYSAASSGIQDLGLDHLIDELKNSIRPDSDLPAHLRWKPEDLEKVTMEQAVRRVHDINQYRAQKKAEANEALARNPATVTFKEYPTVPGSDKPNEKGLAWKEIKPVAMPEDFVVPERYSIVSPTPSAETLAIRDNQTGKYITTGLKSEEQARKHLFETINKQQLQDALKYEGDVMGHCVGGYCDDVLSGNTKIYTLRDKKGEPHVTIEVSPSTVSPRHDDVLAEMRSKISDIPALTDAEYDKAYKEALDAVAARRPAEIIQIKGKANRAPKEEYLPFVQDFVRGGNWSRVGDFQNTGLRDIDRTPKLKEWMRSKNIETPRYLTEQEYGKYESDFLAEQLGMKKGGSVHITDNPDTMALELAGGGLVAAGKAAKAAAKAAEKAVPPKLPRAEPKTKAEIEAIAQRMAPQLTGEYVRKSPESAITVAGKTKKQFEREKELPVQLRGEQRTPTPVDIEALKGKAMIGILGDPSITGRELESVGDVRLESPAPQHGGPLYGMGQEDDVFWASGKGAAQKVQNLAEEVSKQYGTDVLGKYIMMGPEGLNYAQHFADANLQAIDLSRMTKRQVEQFNNLVRKGSPNSGPRPSFPGIEDKEGAYLHMAFDPELRKHFNALMQMSTVTDKFNLPNGQDIRFAITEPLLRDLERGVTGMSIGEMRPGRELTHSAHPTYEMDIPGKFMGMSKYPVPYELMFPDTVKSIRENPRQAPHEFGSLGMVGPRQVIDQQMIDELKAYEEQIRKLTGKKKGGAVKKPAKVKITDNLDTMRLAVQKRK